MKNSRALKFICAVIVMFAVSYASKTQSYNTLENWKLNDKFKPSVVLRLSNGKNVTLVFERQDTMLVIPDKQELIPEGTRFTVPKGYFALCNFYHTELVKGKASRTEDDEGTILTQYEPGSQVEYIRNSGLTMIKREDVGSGNVKASGMTGEYIDDGDDDEDLDISEHVAQSEEGRKDTHEYENRSTKPEDVVKTYGLPQDRTGYILRRHKDALRLRSNRERVNVYSQMFNEYEGDYLAAYYAALANFEMDRGSQAVGWCDKALAINHRYSPAIRLRKRSVGLTKKVR